MTSSQETEQALFL